MEGMPFEAGQKSVEQMRLDKAYRDLFRGPDAEIVIRDLEKKAKMYEENLLSADSFAKTAETLGMRKIVVYILKRAEKL
jgi:hypothetical protein